FPQSPPHASTNSAEEPNFEASVDKSIRTIMQLMTQDAKRNYDRIVFEMVRGGTEFGGWEVAAVLEAEFREATQPSRRSELIPVECDSAADVDGIMNLLEAIGCQRFPATNVTSTFLVVRKIATTNKFRTDLPEGSRIDTGSNINQPFLNYRITTCDDRVAHRIKSDTPRLS
ncbi:MAG: hypothetical protein WCJ09_28195, partial [Planctomycetota bacterium]